MQTCASVAKLRRPDMKTLFDEAAEEGAFETSSSERGLIKLWKSFIGRVEWPYTRGSSGLRTSDLNAHILGIGGLQDDHGVTPEIPARFFSEMSDEGLSSCAPLNLDCCSSRPRSSGPGRSPGPGSAVNYCS